MAFNNIMLIARTSGLAAGSQKLTKVISGATSGLFDKTFGTFTSGLSDAKLPAILSGPYHSETATPALQDPQRDYLYIVNIQQPKFVDMGVANSIDELIIRAKSFTMPTKTVLTQEVNFYGHKQVIPIDVDYDRSVSITFEESQDQFILRNFNSWLCLFDVFSDVVMKEADNYAPGTATNFKSIYKTNIELYMYKYNGSHEATRVTLYNAYPTSLGGASFSYDSSSKITYDISFSYDYFKVEENNLVPNSEGDFNTPSNTVTNFLGINNERIKHGAEVLRKWGPIIAISRGVGAVLAAIESGKRDGEFIERYTKPPLVIDSDESAWSRIASDPRYTNKLEQ